MALKRQDATAPALGCSSTQGAGKTPRRSTRKRFKRTWYNGVLHADRLTFDRRRRDVVIDARTLEETVTTRAAYPMVTIGDRLLVCGHAVDDIAMVQIAAMTDETWCVVRVLTGSCNDGPVKLLRVHTSKTRPTKRQSARGEDRSLMPRIAEARSKTSAGGER